jgi:Immunity protein 10
MTGAQAPQFRTFNAVETGVEQNSFGVTVGFARDSQQAGSLDAFLLQRSSGSAEDEGVYLEVPPQRHAGFGCIVEATLSRKQFEIRLAESATGRFGCTSGFRGELDLDDESFANIRAALRLVFRGCDYYQERT